MAFGGPDKTYISTGPNILGWGMAASFGAKLARPDQPVVVDPGRWLDAVRRAAAALEHGALPGPGHDHRLQQPQLQQRTQPHLDLQAGAQFKGPST